LRLIPRGSVVRVLSGELLGAKWIVGSSPHGCWIGTYERSNQRFLRDSISEGALVVDIGANVGFFTLIASRRVGESGRVIAVEPFPRNIMLLRWHLALNDCSNVEVAEVAMADEYGTERMKSEGSPCGVALSSAGDLEVRIETVDGLLDGLGLQQPTFLKIDVEGAEDRVIAGAMRALAGPRRPALLIATHGSEKHARVLSMLQDLGYRDPVEHVDHRTGNGVVKCGAS